MGLARREEIGEGGGGVTMSCDLTVFCCRQNEGLLQVALILWQLCVKWIVCDASFVLPAASV